MKQILIALAIIALTVLLYRVGLADYLSLDVLKARQLEFEGFYASNPVLLISACAGGLVSSIIGSKVKAKVKTKVTLVEAHKMGGDCLHYGCNPSKALIKSAKVAQMIRTADHYGLDAAKPAFDFRKVMARVHGAIAAIEPNDSAERYKDMGVDVGDHASELIGEYVLAMRHGLRLNKISGTVYAYPAMIEANKFAAGKWKKANAPIWAFPWLEKFHAWRRG